MKHSSPFVLFFTTILLVSLACSTFAVEPPPPPTQAPTSTIYAISISVGGVHTCALLNNGHVACWGNNSYGQLGNITYTEHRTAIEIVGLADVAAISAGGGYSCALMKSGIVKCLGSNDHGQLANGTIGYSTTPVGIPGLENVTAYPPETNMPVQ